MKELKFLLLFVLLINISCGKKEEVIVEKEPSSSINKDEIKEDLNEIINDLSENYIYLEDKEVDLNCIKNYYSQKIDEIKSEEETVLLFEYILDEFYDSHLILNTNRSSSYRLSSPIFLDYVKGKAIIKNVWQTQIENIDHNIIDAQILKINGIEFQQAIDAFPSHCNDKKSATVKRWIGNKILAGRYNEPRILTLKLKNGKVMEYDMDRITFKENEDLLSIYKKEDIAVIRINNSLGNSDLIETFDQTLDSLFDTDGLVIDLRNTVDGGDSYIARGIMGRFIKEEAPYQKHKAIESYGNHPAIERSWVEYVTPRLKTYTKPVVVLVGRWTGSMGEGLAIGFEGMERAEIVGTRMERLAGAMNGFSFRHQKYGYRISTEKLYHINGTPRERYIPTHYIRQSRTDMDETLKQGIRILKK